MMAKLLHLSPRLKVVGVYWKHFLNTEKHLTIKKKNTIKHENNIWTILNPTVAEKQHVFHYYNNVLHK